MTTREDANQMITAAISRQRLIGATILAIERRLAQVLDVRALLVQQGRLESLLLEHPGHAVTWSRLMAAVRVKLRNHGVGG
jgi:hypothetical protein